MTASYSYNPWFNIGMYSSSQQANYFNQVYQKESSYMAISYLRVTNFKVSFNTYANFSSGFTQTLNSLPDVFNTGTCGEFKKFFSIYGTNYIVNAIFGGIVKMTTSFAISVFQTTSIEQIQNDISTQFFLSTQASLTETQEQQLTQLNAIYTSTFKLIGGDPSKYNASSYQAWTSTVVNNPVIINMEMYNYTTLLKPNQTEKIIALNQATKHYFYEPYDTWQNISIAPIITTNGIIVPIIIGMNIYFPVASYSAGYYYNIKTNIWHDILPIPQSGEESYTTACCAVGLNIYCFGYSSYTHQQLSAVYNTAIAAWSMLPSYYNYIIIWSSYYYR